MDSAEIARRYWEFGIFTPFESCRKHSRHMIAVNKEECPMNKGELTKAVAESAGMSQADAGKAVDAVFDTISGAVKDRKQVAIAGARPPRVRAARPRRRPRRRRRGGRLRGAQQDPSMAAGWVAWFGCGFAYRTSARTSSGRSPPEHAPSAAAQKPPPSRCEPSPRTCARPASLRRSARRAGGTRPS